MLLPPPSVLGLPWGHHGPSTTRGIVAERSRHTFQYLKRILDIKQVDWEFAIAQMICVCVAPRKVYQFVDYRKQTKNTWARDDPGFVLLHLLLMVGCSAAYAAAFRVPWWSMKLPACILLPPVTYVVVGVVLASAGFFLAKHHALFRRLALARSSSVTSPHVGLENDELEWSYCFDIHSNGAFPVFLLCSVLQFLLLPLFYALLPVRASTLLSNALYAGAGCYYCFIASLGYSRIPRIPNAVLFLYPAVVILMLAVLLTLVNVSLTDVYLTLLVDPFL